MPSLLGIMVSLADVACFAKSTCVKGIDTESASTKGLGIGAACTKGACIKNASTCAGGACIGAKGADIGDEFIKDTCVGYASGVERLGIHLQSS